MGSNIIHGWTDERVALLTKLWGDGLSASQVARRLGGVSRNAVIGKASRLKLTSTGGHHRQKPSPPVRPTLVARIKASPPRRATVITPPAKPALKLAGRGTVFEEAEAQAPRAELIPEAFAPLPGIEPIPFIERKGRCAWPVGGEGADMLCCGAERDGEGPYCGLHAKRAYQPAQEKKRNGNELARSLRRYA